METAPMTAAMCDYSECSPLCRQEADDAIAVSPVDFELTPAANRKYTPSIMHRPQFPGDLGQYLK